MFTRWHLTNRLQIGADLIIHLLRIGIVQRAAHFGGDLAEEVYHLIERGPALLDIQRDIRSGKRRPDILGKQLLETASLDTWLQAPVVIDLDAPFEHAPHRYKLEIRIQHPFSKRQIIAPEALSDIGCSPPELLDEGQILRFSWLNRNMRPIGWRLPLCCLLLFVEQHQITHIQLIRQRASLRY